MDQISLAQASLLKLLCGTVVSPEANREADIKRWYRGQALRLISTERANALRDVGDDEPAVPALIEKR